MRTPSEAMPAERTPLLPERCTADSNAAVCPNAVKCPSVSQRNREKNLPSRH
jgi:hypothetical protein